MIRAAALLSGFIFRPEIDSVEEPHAEPETNKAEIDGKEEGET